MRKPNSTAILVCWCRLVNYYLSKGFVIIEHNYTQLSSVWNDLRLMIHAIYKQKIDHVMAFTTEISSVANTIKKLDVQYPLHSFFQKHLYHDKQKEIDAIFDEYHIPLFKYVYHPALIQEWKWNIDAAAYGKKQEIKIPSNNKVISFHGSMT